MLDNFQPKPLAEYLKDKYTQDVINPPADPNDAVDAFLKWVEEFFSQNVPVNIQHLASGFALNMPNGEQVSFAEAQTEEQYAMHDEGVPIMKPKAQHPSMHGISDTQSQGI